MLGQVAQNTAFLSAITHHATVRRALTVSLIVGTTLLIINQLDVFLAGDVPPLWKVILTYLTPYAVSSYSTASPVRR